MTQEGSVHTTLRGDHFGRTFHILDFSTEVGGRAGEICALLNDCYPSGTRRDTIGATTRQLAFILTLTELNSKEVKDFLDIVMCAGGLSSWQAHHIIGKLKNSSTRHTREPE